MNLQLDYKLKNIKRLLLPRKVSVRRIAGRESACCVHTEGSKRTSLVALSSCAQHLRRIRGYEARMSTRASGVNLAQIGLYPMPEISDFQGTNSEFAKSEQRYPVKITLVYYAHYNLALNQSWCYLPVNAKINRFTCRLAP
jgi:hypothetical protein